MRMKTPLTKEKVRNHFTYGSWKYLLLAALAVFGWSLIFTTTAYRSPQDKRIDLYAQTTTTTAENMDAFLEPIWREVTPEMEVVSSVALMNLDDYSTSMQLTAYMAAGDGDIYFLTEQYFKSFAAAGSFLELDTLVENGTIQVDGVDLSKGRVAVVTEYDENDQPVTAEQHLYGIPLDEFYGFMSGMQLDNRGLYAAILVNNGNDENVIPFFNALLQAGRGEKEDWMK